ncbi:MAG: MarR family EPS-associated transcriptional regulator [Candidatus Marinimicrobia bacterium]|nr:MarR family EPS-associated transcriptional regulator [Candidatus Neomarinimicrobiota bacterium]
MNNQQNQFEILRKIKKNPQASQRKLAKQLGYSLGKLNYCLKAMKDRGLINILKLYPENIRNPKDTENPKKFGITYLLTKKGLLEKKQLTLHFMKKKMNEYEELQKEFHNDTKGK